MQYRTIHTLLALLLAAGLAACSNSPASSPSPASTVGSTPAATDLFVYKPERFPNERVIPMGEYFPREDVVEAHPPAGARLERTIPMPHADAELRLYADNPASSDELTGYLKSPKSEWRLGPFSSVAAPRASDVPVAPADEISPPYSGLRIGTPVGGNGGSSALLIWDASTDTCKLYDFQGHLNVPMDLDGDGVMEYVGNQTDWVPPNVVLARWDAAQGKLVGTVLQLSPDLFPEFKDRETPSYSSLFRDGHIDMIEMGGEAGYTFYTYDHGTLRRYEPQDTGSRVQAMIQARSPNH